ncbi:PD-(D/E)XK nuclease superfamily protein [Pirellulimonas nuda]|uniref:CRISPR-associated exonuclease Cas4 n=1 Tax=Pirellulimonas nuda TaxID=2528009 RepID=A0A518DAA9_9BACT|nr:CRISPR-associated protein Cas4 [Pirellulimonas nuda]QDU88412.1 PD-(D/E)XK nuclease superfamily protein [Pirellulimonas nuda]
MPFPEADLLPISALQHLLFCERQCALIHVERLWSENLLTTQGALLHRKAHEGKPETRDGERIARGLTLRSLEVGLSGVADIVLWRPPEGRKPQGRTLLDAIRQATAEELTEWSIRPVEYKRGKPKANDCDRVQVCAQALCLEEMLGVTISAGDLYYGQTRRRSEVTFDDPLRAKTLAAATRLHELMAAGETPAAVYEKKCDSCSLYELCLPKAIGRRSARDHFDRELAASLADE